MWGYNPTPQLISYHHSNNTFQRHPPHLHEPCHHPLPMCPRQGAPQSVIQRASAHTQCLAPHWPGDRDQAWSTCLPPACKLGLLRQGGVEKRLASGGPVPHHHPVVGQRPPTHHRRASGAATHLQLLPAPCGGPCNACRGTPSGQPETASCETFGQSGSGHPR